MAEPIITPIRKGRILDMRLEKVTLPNGVEMTFEMVRHPGASAIVALDDEKHVTLIHQFRHAAGGYIWEIPAGTLNAGEEPEACARRELREEAGLDARRWSHLGSILTAPAFCDERIWLFLARDLTRISQHLDEDEVLSVHKRSLAEALQMIREGAIEDAKSIAALHLTAAVLAAP